MYNKYIIEINYFEGEQNNMSKLRVFEAFSGYGSQSMALRNIGVDYEVVAISEIDKYAIQAYEAIHGKVDKLEGLKENVILGKLIPAGTGAKRYRKASYDLELDAREEEPLEALEQELLD